MKAYLVLKFVAFFPSVTPAKTHLVFGPDTESFELCRVLSTVG